MVIVGKVVVSGTLMPQTTSVNDIVVAAVNAGAKRIMLPDDCKTNFDKLPEETKKGLNNIPLKSFKKNLKDIIQEEVNPLRENLEKFERQSLIDTNRCR